MFRTSLLLFMHGQGCANSQYIGRLAGLSRHSILVPSKNSNSPFLANELMCIRWGLVVRHPMTHY